MDKTIYLIDIMDLARITSIQGKADANLCKPYIKMAQDQQLKEYLPLDFYKKLEKDIKDNTLTGDYKLIYDDYIKDMMTYYTAYHMVMHTNFKIGNKGVLKASPDNFETVELEDIDQIAQRYYQLGASVLNQYNKNKHLYDIPELKENDSCKKNQNNAGFNMPWFLEY